VFVIAHAGHLIVSIPLYAGPVILLALALVISTRRERRRAGSAGSRNP
jgi:hypothetical protein